MPSFPSLSTFGLYPGDDLESYYRWNASFRIATGLVMLFSVALILWSGTYYFESYESARLTLLWIVFALLMLLTLGITTPLAASLLIVLFPVAANQLGVLHLGSCIFLFLMLFFVISGSGSRLSVDHWIANSSPNLLPENLRRLIRPASRERLTVAFTWLLISYALLSFAAVCMHLSDHSWRQGNSLFRVFQNTYLTQWTDVFAYLFEHWPVVSSLFLKVGGIAQLVFQLFMLPLMSFRWGRIFVCVWGTIFFVSCIVLFQLSYLPYLSLIMWLILFHPLVRAKFQVSKVSFQFRKRHTALTAALVSLALLFIIDCSLRALSVDVAAIPVWRRVRPLPYKFGLDTPDVFNDREFGPLRYWAVLSRRQDGKTEAVPFTSRNGEREYYHLSNLLNYGNDLSWRRQLAGGQFSVDSAESKAYLERIARFDYRWMELIGTWIYTVTIFRDGREVHTFEVTEPTGQLHP